MWSCAARRGGRIGLSKLGSCALPGSPSCRVMSASASPLGEGRLDFPAKRYPSFWDRVKEQKHGLGNMALSASIAFLAVSIIKQEKELTGAKESAGQLRQQNEALNKRLENFKSVFEKSEAGEESASEVLALLRDVVASNNEGQVDSPAETDKQARSKALSKFMV